MSSSSSFTVPAAATVNTVSPGMVNDSATDVFLKGIGLGVGGKAWSALAAGLGAGDQANWDNSVAVFYQLFVASASGIYLDRLGSGLGIERPAGVGMSDTLYRQLIIKKTSHKLTEEAFLELLEIFYGSDSVRAFSLSVSEPYAINNGDTLLFKVDEQTLVTAVFGTADISIPGAATAIEMSAVITRAMLQAGLPAGFAYAYLSPSTGLNAVKIVSPSLGSGSSIRVLGGSAQNIFQFQRLIQKADVAKTWTITVPSSGVARFTTSGATSVDLSLVETGHYVNIFGAPFNVLNRGSFPITNVITTFVAAVYTQSFDVVNAGVLAEGPITIVNATDIIWFESVKETVLQSGSRAAIVSQHGPNTVDVVFPALTQTVQRQLLQAAYLQPLTTLAISAGVRNGAGVVTLTVPANGLVAGQEVIVDGFFSTAKAPVNAGTNVNPGVSDSSLGSRWNAGFSFANLNGITWPQATMLTTGDAIVCGGSDGGVNSFTSVTLVKNTGHTTAADGSIAVNYTISAAPVMNSKRVAHRLSTLVSGPHINNVVISGGYDIIGAAFKATVDLYDPVGNTTTATGVLNHARAYHESVTLTDGRTLVSGGESTTYATPVGIVGCELYDPSLGTWSNTGSMAVPRACHRTVKLNDGRIMALGGMTTASVATTSVEVFDPAVNTWSTLASMNIGRYSPGAIVLADGRVLVIGGSDGTNTSTALSANSMEIWDPITGRWSVLSSHLLAPVYPQGVQDYTVVISLPARNQFLVGDIFDPVYGDWRGQGMVIDSNTLLPKFLTNPNGDPLIKRHETFAGPFADGSVVSGGGAGGATDTSVTFYIPAADYQGAGGINGIQTLTQGGSSLQFTTVEYPFYALNAGTCTVSALQETAGSYAGPYIFDQQGSVAITGIASSTTTALNSNTGYTSIALVDGSKFPDVPGFVVFGLGYDYQAGPVKYLGKLDANTLSLDFSNKFATTIPSGSDVTWLAFRGPYTLNTPAYGSFFVTDGAQGRVAAEKAVNDVAAAGVTINATVSYSSDIGLGHAGFPTHGATALSDVVGVFAGDSIDSEIATAEVT